MPPLQRQQLLFGRHQIRQIKQAEQLRCVLDQALVANRVIWGYDHFTGLDAALGLVRRSPLRVSGSRYTGRANILNRGSPPEGPRHVRLR